MDYFIQATRHEMNMHTKFQYFNLYMEFQMIYTIFVFLEIYIEEYYENNRMVKFIR
jgi:hypothetical protein